MLTASKVEDKALISGEETSPLSANDVQWSLFHWRRRSQLRSFLIGKQLNFIQHDAGLLSLHIYSAGSVTLWKSPQRCHWWLFQVLSQSSGEGDHSLALSSTRTAVLFLQHVCIHALALCGIVLTLSHSASCRTLSFKAGLQVYLVMNLHDQPAFKPVDWLQSRQPASKPVRLWIEP